MSRMFIAMDTPEYEEWSFEGAWLDRSVAIAACKAMKLPRKVVLFEVSEGVGDTSVPVMWHVENSYHGDRWVTNA